MVNCTKWAKTIHCKDVTIIEAHMVMKELHEIPYGGHFAT